jgi:hypothetical protein
MAEKKPHISICESTDELSIERDVRLKDPGAIVLYLARK